MKENFRPSPLPDAPKPKAPPEATPSIQASPKGKPQREMVPAGDPLDRRDRFSVENPNFVSRKVPIGTTCAQCGGKTNLQKGARPFSSGPYKGGFLCSDCWTLYWDDNPEFVGDAQSRATIAEEARRIRLKRAGDGSSLVFEEGPTRAFLTKRGTIIIDLARLPFGGPDEYDRDRLNIMKRAISACEKHLEDSGRSA